MRGIFVIFLLSTSFLLAEQASAFSPALWTLSFVPPHVFPDWKREINISFSNQAQLPKRTVQKRRTLGKKACDLQQPMAHRQKSPRYIPMTRVLASHKEEVERKKFDEMDYQGPQDFAREILKKRGLLVQYFKLNPKNKRRDSMRYQQVTEELSQSSRSNSGSDSETQGEEYNNSDEQDWCSEEDCENYYSSDDQDHSSGEERQDRYNSGEEEPEDYFEEYNYQDGDYEENWSDQSIEDQRYDQAFEAEDRFLAKFDLRNQKRSNSKDMRKTKTDMARKIKEQEIFSALELAGWIFVQPQNLR